MHQRFDAGSELEAAQTPRPICIEHLHASTVRTRNGAHRAQLSKLRHSDTIRRFLRTVNTLNVD